MSELHTIHVETDPRGVAALILSRPEKRNALSSEMITAMRDAVERLSADPTIRVIRLKGEGESFCAGGDLGWMQDQFAADAATRRKEAKALAHMLLAIDRSPKPVIAEAHGPIFGGGVGLLAVSDVAIAAEDAVFGLPEVRLGILPATIGPYVAARIGAAATRRLFLSGRRFDPAEALRIGLIAETAPAATLADRVESEIEALSGQRPRRAGAGEGSGPDADRRGG